MKQLSMCLSFAKCDAKEALYTHYFMWSSQYFYEGAISTLEVRALVFEQAKVTCPKLYHWELAGRI